MEQDSRYMKKRVLTRDLYNELKMSGEHRGFTYEELRALFGKYGEVYAYPVAKLGSGKVLGVAVLDRPYDPHAVLDALGPDAVRSIAATMADKVRDFVDAAPRLEQ
ncbi:hypothetical protein A5661_11580 [Mycobacterium asiaticum]|nr:hypothetical protein A5661_11580 [Mycobacterium asiaticum]